METPWIVDDDKTGSVEEINRLTEHFALTDYPAVLSGCSITRCFCDCSKDKGPDEGETSSAI